MKSHINSRKPELLAPAGDKSMLAAAVKAGADAIYFGIKGLNMRVAAGNFLLEEVKEVVDYCHVHGVKAYCTINIIIFERELLLLEEILQLLKKVKIDAIICWDLAVVKICKELGLEIHLSTQASVANSAAAIYWKKLGVKRIVLARECSLEDIKEIKEKSKLEIECFVHGARCISLSGRCFISQELFKKSANRGECLQPCRRNYKITDEDGKEMILENNFVMSAKDLCALPILPRLVKIGIDSFKIEGRNRGAEYVFKVTSAYRKAIDILCFYEDRNSKNFNKEQKEERSSKKWNEKVIDRLLKRVKEVYNKGFSTGFFVDYPYHELSDAYGSKATSEKILLGKVNNYYKKNSIVEFKVESVDLFTGDKIAFIGGTTGYVEMKVKDMHNDSGKIQKAQKGEIITIKTTELVRENDKIYLIKDRFATKSK
ncbi:U32 family peptidase [Candidatus Woesearchaeota archaeon]|nr:U32 family peptidase [Candidatus Woesearchaeota archaeon]